MRTTSNITESLSLTLHADLRFSQRGISAEAAQLVMLHGSDLPAGSGAKKRYLTHQTKAELLNDDFPVSLVEAASRLELVISADEVVMTGYRRDTTRISPRKNARSTRNRRMRRLEVR